MSILVIGGGIAGLTFALSLKQRGIACQVYEAAPEVKELGVGITLLPHGVREFSALGLEPQLRAAGIENRESAFFTRHGQFIYKELRGALAGYPYPEIGMHRGKLHRILYEAALKALGPENVHTNHQCVKVEQDDSSVTVHFRETSSGKMLAPVKGSVAIAADGVNSTVRRQFYPDEKLAFGGINTWRGVTRMKPILDGRTYMRVGSIETGKLVIYPIVNDVDGQGNQLINWVAEIRQDEMIRNDWNKPGKLEELLPIYQDWKFDWLDVPEMLRNAELILEYPMVDKDPIPQWTFGRVTLMGDAAHPMYPRGSNGSAQALVDARTLADLIAAASGDAAAVLKAYEVARLEPTAKVVLTNRQAPPDLIIIKVEELTGGKPFRHIDDVISQEELRQISDNYKNVAGFSLDSFKAKAGAA
jgi:2-polyprenyl-6-methoxyphenol hydroxylase-like FAD-dependent oxidoreductase